MSTTPKPYPSDATDAEWEFLLPYLTLMRQDAPQRRYPPRDLFRIADSITSRDHDPLGTAL